MGILWDTSFIGFLVVTLALGGGAAWMAGRAVASTWRPRWHLVPTAFVLAFAVRFLHFALLGGSFLLTPLFITDMIIMFAIASLGFARRRAIGMARQYAFAFEPAGFFGWRRKKMVDLAEAGVISGDSHA